MRNFKSKGWAGLAVWAGLLMIFAAGCANLGAIRNFADQSSDIAGYTKLVNYYVDAPMARARYQPAANLQQLEQSKKKKEKQKELLLARHKIIQSYMDALGRLAADEAVVYDKEITTLVNAVGQSELITEKLITKEEVAAFGALGKLIARAATDLWRQNKLRELIKEGNRPLQELVGYMQHVVTKGYVDELDNESASIDKYYGKFFAESSDPAGKEALMEWKNARLSEVNVRREEVEIYSKALGKIAAGHQELYNNLNQLDAKSVLDQMIVYARYLRDAKNALASL